MSWVGKLGGRKVAKVNVVSLWVGALMLFGEQSQAGLIGAINHTHWAINRFSVDGKSGVDIVGAYQGGGGGCCFAAPIHWYPGMTVRIDWETGVAGTDGFPGFADRKKYESWLRDAIAKTRKHSRIVDVPDYTGEDQCGITVHFLPCDELAVTTSCHRYGSQNYPIKHALHLPEPKVCQKRM